MPIAISQHHPLFFPYHRWKQEKASPVAATAERECDFDYLAWRFPRRVSGGPTEMTMLSLDSNIHWTRLSSHVCVCLSTLAAQGRLASCLIQHLNDPLYPIVKTSIMDRLQNAQRFSFWQRCRSDPAGVAPTTKDHDIRTANNDDHEGRKNSPRQAFSPRVARS